MPLFLPTKTSDTDIPVAMMQEPMTAVCTPANARFRLGLRLDVDGLQLVAALMFGCTAEAL